VAILLFIPACLFAGWWQATRAFSGNALSYIYAVEWPLLAGFGIWGWWAWIHTEKPTPEQVAEREAFEATQRAEAQEAATAATADVDPDMAAYNAHLRRLAEQGKKTWKH